MASPSLYYKQAAENERLRTALGSLQEMLAKQIIGKADGAQCAACGLTWEPEERHADDCPVARGLYIIEQALNPPHQQVHGQEKP